MSTFGRIVLDGIEPCLYPAGIPIVGATLTVTVAGTPTLATIYADAAGSTPVSNPLTSDAAGRFYGINQANTTIWADNTQAYDLNVTYPAGGNTTYLNVYTLGPAPVVTGFAPINSPTFTGIPRAPTPASNDSSSEIATTQFVANAIARASIVPPGQYGFFGMLSLPGGWLLCDGSAVSRSTYGALFGAIGTTYGSGDGSTTFNVPNFQGYFPRGLNASGSGPDPSRALGAVQLDAFQGHYHSPLSPDTTFLGAVAAGGNLTIGTTGPWLQQPTTGSPVTDGTNGTPRTATETRPVNLAVVVAIHI